MWHSAAHGSEERASPGRWTCRRVRSDMKNLAHCLAVPISDHVVTFISLVAAAALPSRTTVRRSGGRWQAGVRSARRGDGGRAPAPSLRPPIHC
ncbi:unnamed protein product [Plutella xylostella]|uniref:(diamondback moth) hypothetical protein n=1 Tax=Plutella xylostella TaxID=51655 RepID=A0A8S4EMG1_PLUXY|nr:unnamed protein product [Plutella xylostella]